MHEGAALLAIYARRALRIATAYAVVTLLSGLLIAVLLGPALPAVAAAILGVLLCAPGLVLLHCAWTLGSLPARLTASQWPPRGAALSAVALGAGLLLRPWYWALVLLSAAVGGVLIPLTPVVALLRA